MSKVPMYTMECATKKRNRALEGLVINGGGEWIGYTGMRE